MLDRHAALARQVEDWRENSLDYYVFVRDAYLQRREDLIRNGEPSSGLTDDLYELEDGDDAE